MPGQLAAGHDHPDVPQRAQILQRVCSGHDQVCALARRNGAGLAADAGELRAPARCGVESEGVGDAGIFVEIKQLAPEIILGDPRAADVVAEHDGNVVGKRGLRAVDDALKDDRAVVLLDLSRVGDGTVKQRVGQGRRDRRAEKRAGIFEQAQDLRVRLCAVLDGVNAVFERDLDTLGALDMRGDRQAKAVRLVAGSLYRWNRTEYYDKVKDLLGGDYWYDIDKFAERDMASTEAYQNDLDYYWETGHARVARVGDKYGYYYRAHLLETNAWANYTWGIGGFSLGLAGSVGYSQMYREGMWRKGLFPNNSKGDSKKLDYLTYEGKLSLGYKFSGAHSLEANAVILQQAPKFATAFVSPRTRNTTTPGLKAEKVFGVDLTYNLNLPYVKARLSGYYTTIKDQSKVISFYDDTRSSFTNFAMSGIDKEHYGVELGLSVPVWQGLSVVGAVSWGEYTYTSHPNFVQPVDYMDRIVLKDKVNWDGFHVESSPQLALIICLDYRGPRNWFAGVNFNYYDNLYLSMNPLYRTATATEYYTNQIVAEVSKPEPDVEVLAQAIASVKKIRNQEKFGGYYTLSANVGKNWYIHRNYMLGFSLEVKIILNDQDIRTGGYEQMRMSKVRGNGGEQIYGRFPSKYFYLFGTTYYLNVYFRF